MLELTKKQQELYDFYSDPANWRPPTIKACREHMNVSSDNSVLGMLDYIGKKGFDLTQPHE